MEEIVIQLYKAESIKSEEVPNTLITIKSRIPDKVKEFSLKQLNKFYQDQAEKLVKALSQSLPQGTKHKLLGLMMKEWQNLYMGV